jgi:hypothetical protein
MKDEALRFQEKLEKGFINRLETRDEISPKSVQRRKYELEKWVTVERTKVREQKNNHHHPINVFDLDQERREAASIIEQVNRKVKEIQDKIDQSK